MPRRRFLRRGARLGLRAFLTRPARIQEKAAATTDLDAAVAILPLPLGADQRTDPVGLAAHGVQRIKTCELDIELGVGVLVEEIERLSRAVIPGAVDIP